MTEQEEVKVAENSEPPSEPQVIQVGQGFIAGWESNAEIDCLLGHDTDHAGCSPIRRTQEGLVAAPNYDQEGALTARLLRQEGVEEWLHCFTVDQRKRITKGSDPFVPEHVLVFAWRGELHATAPQMTPGAALACALWSVLNISHH